MRGLANTTAVVTLIALLCVNPSHARSQTYHQPARSLQINPLTSDSLRNTSTGSDSEHQMFRNAWGIDILISDGGFGLGTFYRYEFSDEWSGIAALSVSESKDDREVEQYDLYTGTSYVPGKLNRFLILPLTFGIQRRLFKDDITENFRPYINAGAGPTMIYVSPFTDIVTTQTGALEFRQVEYFKALGKGHPEYTLGAFIGFGANFGAEKSNLFGVNFRYYFTYVLGNGLPSLYNLRTGTVSATKKDFGGFFITLNVGMAY